jgi:hypothetical protein
VGKAQGALIAAAGRLLGAVVPGKAGRFLREIAPDLVTTGLALFEQTGGDPVRARGVLSIVRDHGARLDRERLELDRELAEMRAERAGGREQS